jgi:purine nucleosidase/pyrimidine-specific ribonucleoside hydrolase
MKKNIFTQIAATVATSVAIAVALAVDAPSSNAASLTPTPLIVDDDGSQDGLAALAYMLANPNFDVQAITMSHGVARPESEDFQNGLKRMLGRLEATDIPVGIGSPVPLDGNNAFPDFIRNDADNFFAPFVTLPEEIPSIEFEEAAELIVETVKNSPEPVAILSTGSLTNIAEALRIDPSIINNIEVLQIMGGAVFVPGNLGVLPEAPFSTNTVAEFNIWVDPLAASEVFEAGEAGLNIQLTPLDATNKIAFDREDYEAWLATGTPESILAAQLLDFSLVVVGGDVNPNPLWDMVAAINLSESAFSPETPLHIEVDTESAPGATQGQTNAVSGLPPNVFVSLDPSFDNLPFNASEVFSYLEETKSVPEPTSVFGLLALLAIGVGSQLNRKAQKP